MTPKDSVKQLAILIVTIFAVALPYAHAAVIEVPGEHASISAAIAAAEDGDTVRVAPGTWVENIDYLGKAITITSHYEAGGDWSLVERTIIDGSASNSDDAASTVSFHSGEGRSSMLQGCTITGGRGTTWVDPLNPDYTWHGGGGVFIFQSSPTIRYCVISGNQAQIDGTVDGIQGGGVLTYGGHPLIHNNIIAGNQADYGGGLVIDYSGAEVFNTVVADNTVADSYGGGGIWTIGSSDDPIEITNCTVVDNVSGSYGGGILVWNSTVVLHNSVVRGNEYGEGFSNIDVAGAAGEITIDHSNVEGGADGDGNMDLDPGFSDLSIYHLDPSSPCVDAGNPASEFDDPEDPAAAGRAKWPAQGALHNDMGAFGGPRAMAMSRIETPAPTVVFIPAAAASPGASGSFFVTDVEINNPGTETLSYRFLWLPRNTDNIEPTQSDLFTLGSGMTARYSNVLSEVFGEDEAVGALAVTAESGSFHVVSRTYNLTEDGTFGQTLPGIPTEELTTKGERVRLLFMSENADFRSNLGILNGGSSSMALIWELHSSDGSVLETGSAALPAFGNTQINHLFGAYAPIEAAYVDVWTPTEGAAFACYGSDIDNNSNDPTTIAPQ